jgi:hypothetical protein
LRDSSIINSSFVLESIRSDSSQLLNISLITDESNAKMLYSQTKNINENEDENEDENNEIVDENIIKSRADLNKRVPRLIKSKNKKISFEKNLIIDSDSDESTLKIIKRESKNRSIADVLIEMQIMKFKNFITRFEYEIRQRDQHHKKLILKQKKMMTSIKMQHEKRIMRLQIELKKTSQKKL